MRTSTRLLLALLVAVVAVALLVGVRHGSPAPDDRPAHLVDLQVGAIERVDVRDPATGRTGRLARGPGGLMVAEGPPLSAARVRALERDLAPLLAIRLLDRRRPEHGLDPPRLDVTITAPGRAVHLLVGADNFDRTAVYVGVGSRTALVLPEVGRTLGALVGQAEP